MSAPPEPDINRLHSHIHGNKEDQIKGIYPRLEELESKLEAVEAALEEEELKKKIIVATVEGKQWFFKAAWNGVKFFLPATFGSSVAYAAWAWYQSLQTKGGP